MELSKVEARRIGREIRNAGRTREDWEMFQRGSALMELSFDSLEDPLTVPKEIEEDAKVYVNE